MNSNRFPAPFLAAASALCLLAQPLLGGTLDLFTYTDNGTSITITDYPDDAVGAVVIPVTIIGKPVTSIGELAFYYCTGLTSVTFLGSAPEMHGRVFGNSAPGFKVYYLDGQAGFTWPKWHGYPTAVVGAAIRVQQPIGTTLADGMAKRSFGTVVVGQSGTARTFTIRNIGSESLTGLSIPKTGAVRNFTLTALADTTLAPGASMTFKVTFSPIKTGTHYAAIHISSNDASILKVRDNTPVSPGVKRYIRLKPIGN